MLKNGGGRDVLPRNGGALGSVCFQYVGLGREQFCQYIVSMLEYLGGIFGGYVEGVGIVGE